MASDEVIAGMCSALGTDPHTLRLWAMRRANELITELEPGSDLAVLLDRGSPLEEIEEIELEEIEELELEELEELEEAEDPAEAPVPSEPSEPSEPAPPVFRREHERFALDEEVTVRVSNWSDLVRLQARDISQGGMFVHSDEPPPRHETITIEISLPDGGSIELQGEVVHVLDARTAEAVGQDPGFGVQFTGLSSDRKQALRTLVRHAMSNAAIEGSTVETLQELGFQPSASGTYRMSMTNEEVELHDQLRARVQSMRTQNDLEILGLGPGCTASMVVDSYFKLAGAWHPDVSAKYAAPEIKRLATEVFLLLSRAYQNLREPGVLERHGGVTQPEPAPPSHVVPTHVEPEQSRPLLARRLASRLGEIRRQGNARPVRLTKPGGPPPPPSRDPRIDEAIAMMSKKDYAGAVRLLEATPLADKKLRILLYFAKARLALRGRNYEEAIRLYRGILEVDDENPTAQREVIMVEALMASARD